MKWDPRLPAHWAKLLGLVVVSLFGRERNRPGNGEHVVLLDGAASSLTLSLGSADSLLSSKQPAQWAWSSHVGHAAVLDSRSNRLYWFRSDTPESINEVQRVTPDAAQGLLTAFAADVTNPSQTSVQLALDVFRSLRVHLRDDGANDLDVIRSFNVLLLWADAVRAGNAARTEGTTLAEAVQWCNSKNLLPYTASDFTHSAFRFPLGQLTEQLLDARRGFPLDPYLLVRHASGTLFQEAHVDLDRPPSRQRRLFTFLFEETRAPHGLAARDTQYTPASLARFLTEVAVDRFKQLNNAASTIDVFDPACGSGVFLIEACRAIGNKAVLRLRGCDKSAASVVIAQFAVQHAARSAMAEGNVVSLDIRTADSLGDANYWGTPDIILMNPPFLSWRMLSAEERSQIRDSLGDLYVGQSDTAIAFVAKACASLKPGAVLATLVPGSFLNSRAASRVRRLIEHDETLSVDFIGLFRGFTYFAQAAVEPAWDLPS